MNMGSKSISFHYRPPGTLIMSLIVLPWGHVNRALELLRSHEVGGPCMDSMSKVTCWNRRDSKDKMHLQTPDGYDCP
jgi:hypothetical protein